MRPAQIALLLISLVGPALAEDDRSKRVREELERQLDEMVKLPPASVEVMFDGIDSTRYKLLEAIFALDDRPIPFTPGTKILYAGEVQPGKHTLSATFSYEAPATNSGTIKFKVPGKFIFSAQRGILMRVRAHIEVDDAAEPSKRLQLVGNAETDLRAKLEDSLPPPPQEKGLEAHDKGAIRYGKKAARAETAPEEEAASPPPKRKSSVGTKVALASPKASLVHPAALKREGDPHTASAAVDAVARPTQAAKPSPPTPKAEDVDAGAVASSEGDGGFPLAPLPVIPSSPPASASAPPPAKATGATGMAVFGAALAAIGLLVFALARRGR